MNILSDEQYRVLAFVAACNRSAYRPTSAEIMLWHKSPDPAEAEYRVVEGPGRSSIYGPSGSLTKMVETMVSQTSSFVAQLYGKQELVKKAETVTDHLIRLTWLERESNPGSGLRLTELGRALLRDRELDTDEPDISVVVLEAEDPLAYPLLVGQLANAGKGLLIDPFLTLDGLNRIVVSTQLTRLLVSGKPRNQREVSAIQTHLDSLSLGRNLEVRKSTRLHDRILMAEDGAVLTLGTSLNGVGLTTTVLTPIPTPAREVLRDLAEKLWLEAELVGPRTVEATSGEAGEDDVSGGAGGDAAAE